MRTREPSEVVVGTLVGMAYVVPRRDGRFEIRESVQTERGPRCRTLANFAVLKRFITLALCAPTAPVCLVMGGSSLEYFAAGQQRRKDKDDRRLRRHRLLDRAVD